jgi:asparagine synthase (glutamine-hydrolysing)
VAAQLRFLDHRGPDARGVYDAGFAAIGQTRLSVVDLVTGDPPVSSADGAVGACLNGEIYNFRELRSALAARGVALHTSGDTEVLAASMAAGSTPEALARQLDGMFAFAVVDRRSERVVLGRDRFGKKPLYYWTDGSRLVFASEIKALVCHPAVPRRLDVDALPSYLYFGYVPTPKTFYEGIRALPPGHVLVSDPSGIELRPYWDLPLRSAGSHEPLSSAEGAAMVRDCLRQSVGKRLIADVPVGAFLSGGIDSSAVVALMAEASEVPVRTFTIGFDEEQFDERDAARTVAEHLGTDHTEFVVRPDAVDLLDRLVWHHDQPFGDSSAVPTFLLSELTRSHVTVALSGDGGDEVFAGYQRFAWALALDRARHVPRAVRRAGVCGLRASRFLAGSRAERLAGFLDRVDDPLVESFHHWITYVPGLWRERLLAGTDHRAAPLLYERWSHSEGADLLDRLQDLTLRTYLLDDLLPKADRSSMAHGLEVRSPFLDDSLLDLAMRLPPTLRIRRGRGKAVLREAVADLLPSSTSRRPKWGFGIPLDRWFRGELAPYAKELLGSEHSRVRQHLDPSAIDALLAAHGDGASLGHTLWALCTLEAFLRREGW